MMLQKLPLLAGGLLLLCGLPVQALDCARAASLVENTVCDVPELRWLDRVLTDSVSEEVLKNPERVAAQVNDWAQTRDACRSAACLRGAYLTGIARLYQVRETFDWQGDWWNTSATAGNGGRIRIKHPAKWQYSMDVEAWGGSHRFDFSSGLDFYGGLALSYHPKWGGDCALVLIPLPDGRLKVSSDQHRKCDVLLPGAMTFDGIYEKAPADPRPPASLLSLGILPDQALDDRFRQLVGSDYQRYLATATRFVYGDDLDNRGATVVSMWYEGMANRRAAIVMTTPQGDIWAMRVEPGKKQRLDIHYATTAQDKSQLPQTLQVWRARFAER